MSTKGLDRHLPAGAGVPATEMQPQFANIATPSEIVVSTSFTLRDRRHLGHGALLHPLLDAGADPRRAVQHHRRWATRSSPTVGG